MNDPTPRKSDLGVRTLSAIVMVAVASVALWLGGYAWMAFVVIVAGGVLYEWRGLVRGFVAPGSGRIVWNLGGIVYIGLAAAMLLFLRENGDDPASALVVVALVIATDIGAYFAGRTIGGPKIAPAISPSKTWAGLGGGIVGAGVVGGAFLWLQRGSLACDTPARYCVSNVALIEEAVLLGFVVAVVAQSGDFFESWMKRRAGVKDSGNLIPGHGGLFDRVDGLLAVCAVFGFVNIATGLTGI